jgi:hypothetical protein
LVALSDPVSCSHLKLGRERGKKKAINNSQKVLQKPLACTTRNHKKIQQNKSLKMLQTLRTVGGGWITSELSSLAYPTVLRTQKNTPPTLPNPNSHNEPKTESKTHMVITSRKYATPVQQRPQQQQLSLQ